jgi:hypothetical protein
LPIPFFISVLRVLVGLREQILVVLVVATMPIYTAMLWLQAAGTAMLWLQAAGTRTMPVTVLALAPKPQRMHGARICTMGSTDPLSARAFHHGFCPIHHGFGLSRLFTVEYACCVIDSADPLECSLHHSPV